MPQLPPGADKRLASEVERLALRQLVAASLRRRVRLSPMLVLLLVVLGLVQTSADLWLGPWGADQVLLAGALIPELVVRGEVWRLLSSVFLHADPLHLLLNGVMLWVVGRPVEAAWGTSRFVLLYVGSGLAGSMATLALRDHGWTVGASGAIYGLMGALVALGARLWLRLSWSMRQSMVLLPAALLLLLLALGDSDGRLDFHAHRGGALGGFLLGLVLRPQLRLMDRWTAADALRGEAIRWLSRLAALLTGAALAIAGVHTGTSPDLPPLAVETFALDKLQVAYPAGLRRGTWSRGTERCEGELTDGAWALRTGRLPCFPLPLGGYLLIGRRDALLTLDDGDRRALQTANQTGGWVRRQAATLLYPVGSAWLYVVAASEPLLPTYQRALQRLLPPPGAADLSDLPTAEQLSAPEAGLAEAVTPQD